MLQQAAQNQYLNSQVQTASPGDLTLMLYNGCLRFMKMGVISIEQGKIEEKHYNLTRALNIIEELQVTLDMKYDISQNLFALYDYVTRLITTASLKLDVEKLQEAITLMSELRDTWASALKQVKMET
ncbi:flagellar export chaperone FliS [Paenibacillus sediminis]|uniref:Flagellar secretion chaperone FliS n=1 Tax=Paenibacillus sediminis TaxID=664909 RepID=A0ABS4H293_9BACL|nr:flagellar export chaperone FliS [Paenibacillus sediminis]MBP1936654.1 flagellar protein FliS [Paenibacillus sediminis]